MTQKQAVCAIKKTNVIFISKKREDIIVQGEVHGK
jgi:hypothetical protein